MCFFIFKNTLEKRSYSCSQISLVLFPETVDTSGSEDIQNFVNIIRYF